MLRRGVCVQMTMCMVCVYMCKRARAQMRSGVTAPPHAQRGLHRVYRWFRMHCPTSVASLAAFEHGCMYNDASSGVAVKLVRVSTRAS